MHRYYVSPSEKFIDYSTKWQWINFAAGGDSGIISAKTSNPSNIYLEVSIMYRIREENLHDIYKKWPTKSIQRDFILFAKVRPSNLTTCCRTPFKKYPRITPTTTSSPTESRLPR